MKPLADAIGLRTFRFCACVVNPFEVQVQRKLVMLAVAAVLAAPVGQYPEQWNTVFFVPRQHPVIEHVSGSDGVFTVVELDHDCLAIAVNEGLLVNAANAFDVAHVIGVLTSQVARVLGFDFSVSLLFLSGFFQGTQLVFREDEPILGNLG